MEVSYQKMQQVFDDFWVYVEELLLVDEVDEVVVEVGWGFFFVDLCLMVEVKCKEIIDLVIFSLLEINYFQ